MTISVAKYSFTGGEWSPSLHSRADLAKYASAVKTMKNFVPSPQGGVSNRPGTKFIQEVKDSSKTVRLIPFQYSTEQAYMLEFGDEYIRVYKDGAAVLEADKTITGATQADPVVITSTGHSYENGDWVVISGVVGMTELNGRTFVVANKAANTFELTDTDGNDIDGTGFTAYSSAGVANRVYTLSGNDTAVNISGVTQADPAVVTTSTAHGLVSGDIITIAGVVGMTELNGNDYLVRETDYPGDSDFQLYNLDGSTVDSTGYTAYSSGGTVQRHIVPYAEADLPNLKYVQNADTLTLTHPDYAPRDLTRTAHTSWSLDTIEFGPSIAKPANVTRSVGTGTTYIYSITCVSFTGEESRRSTLVQADRGDTLDWDTNNDAAYYVIYQQENGVYGYIGISGTSGYVIPTGVEPDLSDNPPNPWARLAFDGPGNWPGVCTYYQQRKIFARTDNAPQTIEGSVVGSYNNMDKRETVKDDDAFEFTINANQVNEIRFMMALDQLIVGTSGGEWAMTGGSGALSPITPSSVSMRRQSRWGSSDVRPLVIGNSVLFIEDSQEAIRDLAFTYESDGYAANDLTLLANHLFRGRNITDWCYQRTPDSVIWCVRDDGLLLGLTYYREHDVTAWHQHNTNGKFENVASITNSDGMDDVYMIVKRTINGTTKRFVEKFETRLAVNTNYKVSADGIDVEDAFFVDSGLSLDDPKTITAIASSNPLQVTVTGHGWTAAKDGNSFDVSGVGGMTEINKRFQFEYIDANTIQLNDLDTGADVDASAYTTYTEGGEIRECVTTITGLHHLEGESISVLANGDVISSKTVSNGGFTLTNAASRVHAGLAYTSDLETLDFQFQTQSGTGQDKTRYIKSVVLDLDNSRAMSIGPNETRLIELAFRSTEDYGSPIALFTGEREVMLESGTGRDSRLFIRNNNPVPLTILGIIARIDYGES